jgi:hypothetical protein
VTVDTFEAQAKAAVILPVMLLANGCSLSIPFTARISSSADLAAELKTPTRVPPIVGGASSVSSVSSSSAEAEDSTIVERQNPPPRGQRISYCFLSPRSPTASDRHPQVTLILTGRIKQGYNMCDIEVAATHSMLISLLNWAGS